jgi:hypothetical protein
MSGTGNPADLAEKNIAAAANHIKKNIIKYFCFFNSTIIFLPIGSIVVTGAYNARMWGIHFLKLSKLATSGGQIEPLVMRYFHLQRLRA